jgi:hypothetical protein
MKEEQACTIALQALAYIASEENALIGLMNLSGLSLEAMKTQAGDPLFLAGVMDFILSDEPLLLAFCEAAELPPEMPLRVRRALPGGRELEY